MPQHLQPSKKKAKGHNSKTDLEFPYNNWKELITQNKKFMSDLVGLRLEKYTLKRKDEVLMVNLETALGEPDVVMIYAGFSSSLMRSTAFDPDIPVIAEDSKIISIDRLASPYNPDNPRYIASDMTWQTMENMLQQINI